MNEEKMLKPALAGGVLLGILSSIPIINLFNCACCAWVICGGVLAAYLYVKDSPVPVTLGRGVALGLVTGLIGTVVSALFSIPLLLLAVNRPGMGVLVQLRQALDQIPNIPPETREMLRSLSARGGTDVLFFAIGLIFTLVIYCLFAMLGGAIGVAVFEKRKTGAPPADYQPPTGPPPPPPAL
jgi:hypothetical protein